MPNLYKHVFLEVDIPGLIAATGNEKPTAALVREYSSMYDQGSMVEGDPETSFAITVETGSQIYFTIIPKKLTSYSLLYFAEFKVETQTAGIIVPGDIKVKDHDLTFVVPVIQADPGGEATFNIYGTLQFKVAGSFATIPLIFDPVLRANQGPH